MMAILLWFTDWGSMYMYFIFFQWFIIFVAYTVGLVTLFYICTLQLLSVLWPWGRVRNCGSWNWYRSDLGATFTNDAPISSWCLPAVQRVILFPWSYISKLWCYISCTWHTHMFLDNLIYSVIPVVVLVLTICQSLTTRKVTVDLENFCYKFLFFEIKGMIIKWVIY